MKPRKKKVINNKNGGFVKKISIKYKKESSPYEATNALIKI